MLDRGCKDATRARRSFPLGVRVEQEGAYLLVRKLCVEMAAQQRAHATHGFPSCDASEPAPKRALGGGSDENPKLHRGMPRVKYWHLRPGHLLFSLMRTFCLQSRPSLSIISGFIHFFFSFSCLFFVPSLTLVIFR